MVDLALDKHVAMTFATPVIGYPWPDSDGLNDDLARLILDLERQGGGMTRSNVGGWHGSADFFSRTEPCVSTLRQRIIDMTIAVTRMITLSTAAQRHFDFSLDGWANVSRHGAYNSMHNHPGGLWSGTYYVRAGTPEPATAFNGRLELFDPRAGATMAQMPGTILGARHLFEPIPGLMVVFPAWLHHFVHPFFGRGERISVAFNIVTKERKPM